MTSTLSSGDAALAVAQSGAITAEIASIGVGSALPITKAEASPAITASNAGRGGRAHERDGVIPTEVIGCPPLSIAVRSDSRSRRGRPLPARRRRPAIGG